MEEATGEVAFGEESSCNEHLEANKMDLQTEKNNKKPSCKTRCGKAEKGQEKDKNEENRTTAQKRKLDQGNNNCDAVQIYNDNDNTSTVCDGCGTNENVNHYCINCPGNLCDSCKNSHANVNLHKTHQVLQRSDQTAIKSRLLTKTRCGEHLKDICMYCKQCKAPCCLECIAMNHNGHDCMRIEDAYKQAREGLLAYLEKIEKDFHPIPAKLKTEIEDREMNMQMRKHNSETYVSTKIKTGQLELKNIEQQMMGRINSIFAEENKDLDELELVVKQHENKLNDTATKYRQLLKESSDQTVLMANLDKPDLQSMVLPELTLPTPYNLKDESWKLSIKQQSIMNCKVTANEVLYNPKSKSESATFSNSFNFNPCIINPRIIERTVIEKCHTFVRCKRKIAITKNNGLWMLCKLSVKLYETSNGKTEEKFDILQNVRIKDFAVKDDNGIVVSDKLNKSIAIVSSMGSVTKTRDIAPYTPFGVHVNKSQEVILCVDKNDDYKQRCALLVFSPDLEKVVQEIENDLSGRPLFKECIKKLVQNGNGDYVGIEKFFGVVCVSNEGVWRWQYKKCDLRDVACDKYHNVLVFQKYGHNICILSSDGQLIKLIANVLSPIAFNIDSMGVLWILHNDYEYDNYGENFKTYMNIIISKLNYLDQFVLQW